MKVRVVIAIIIVAALVLSFEVYGFPNMRPRSSTILSRFLLGISDGITSIFLLIASFFDWRIGIYSIRDSCLVYNIGYMVGVGVLFGHTVYSKYSKKESWTLTAVIFSKTRRIFIYFDWGAKMYRNERIHRI